MKKKRKPSRKAESVVRSRALLRKASRQAPVEIDPRVARKLNRLRVPPRDLRWNCSPSELSFKTTRDVRPLGGLIGQRPALKAVRMGLAMESPGYNLFLCGLNGTSKLALIEDAVRSIYRVQRTVPDRCYVYNFDDPRRPKLLELRAGDGHRLQSTVSNLLHTLHVALEKLPERNWRSRAREVLDRSVPAIQESFPEKRVVDWLRQWRRSLLDDIRQV